MINGDSISLRKTEQGKNATLERQKTQDFNKVIMSPKQANSKVSDLRRKSSLQFNPKLLQSP
jgi:hypothetical protein